MKTQPMGRQVLCCVCQGTRVTVLLLLIAVYFVLFAFTMSTRYATASVAWQPPESSTHSAHEAQTYFALEPQSIKIGHYAWWCMFWWKPIQFNQIVVVLISIHCAGRILCVWGVRCVN